MTTSDFIPLAPSTRKVKSVKTHREYLASIPHEGSSVVSLTFPDGTGRRTINRALFNVKYYLHDNAI